MAQDLDARGPKQSRIRIQEVKNGLGSGSRRFKTAWDPDPGSEKKTWDPYLEGSKRPGIRVQEVKKDLGSGSRRFKTACIQIQEVQNGLGSGSRRFKTAWDPDPGSPK